MTEEFYETGLHELTSDDQFVIPGRGQVFSFARGNMPDNINHPNEFGQKHVMIDGKRYYVIGVETAGRSYPYTGAYGLLVREA